VEWDDLVEVARGGEGCALVAVEDDEGLETAFEIDVVAWEGFAGIGAGGDLGGVEGGHLGLGLVGSAAEQSLEDEGREGAEEGEDDSEGKGVEEDGARNGLVANHEQVLLDGGFEQVGEEGGPEVEAGV